MSNNVRLAVLVAALGYFVDVYDLILFTILRVPSLTDLGVPQDQLLAQGSYLLNMQMGGFLVGGVVWGIVGDKIGRIQLLFGSILLYSIGNMLNGFVGQMGDFGGVSVINQYALLRLVAGFGLAGEIGGGITLVSELLPKESRGFGTTIVVATGVAGAVVAAMVYKYFTWRGAYIAGGVLGLLLLGLRMTVAESGLFKMLEEKAHVSRGNFLMLFNNWDRFLRYLNSILIGLPIWYSLGILVTFSPEITKALGFTEAVTGVDSVFWFYCGITIGSVANGLLSQLLRSRKLAVGIFLIATVATIALIFHSGITTAQEFYTLIFALGFTTAYWAMFVTVAAEQFGTNLRATVATSVPNFVRGATVPMVALFGLLKSGGCLPQTTLCILPSSIVDAAEIVGLIAAALAFFALGMLRETFGIDLDYVEGDAEPIKQKA